MILFLYLIAVILSLFILYSVAKHDFVLIRQGISLRAVFDNALIAFFLFFLTSRIFYIIYNASYSMFNPLQFFYLTKYWGILPYTGAMMMGFFISILFRKRKNKLRILDIYFIAITPIILLDVLLQSNSLINLAIKAVSLIVLISFYGWFIKIHNKFSTKDGFISMLTIITYSLVTLAFSLAQKGIFFQNSLWLNLVSIIAVVLSSVMLFFIQRDTFNRQ